MQGQESANGHFCLTITGEPMGVEKQLKQRWAHLFSPEPTNEAKAELCLFPPYSCLHVAFTCKEEEDKVKRKQNRQSQRAWKALSLICLIFNPSSLTSDFSSLISNPWPFVPYFYLSNLFRLIYNYAISLHFVHWHLDFIPVCLIYIKHQTISQKETVHSA